MSRLDGGETRANLFMPFFAGVVDDPPVEVVAPQVSDVSLQRLVFAPAVGLLPFEGLAHHLMRALFVRKEIRNVLTNVDNVFLSDCHP